MDNPTIQDASAALEQAKQSPPTGPVNPPEGYDDAEWRSLQADGAMLARHAQDLQSAHAMIEQQLAAGQISPNEAIAYKGEYEKRWGEASKAVKSLSEREAAYRKRRAQQDEAEVIRNIPTWADSAVKEQEARQLTDYLSHQGKTQEQISKMSAKEVVSAYKQMEAAKLAQMSRQERKMAEFDQKLQAKQMKEAEKGTPPPSSFAPHPDNTQESVNTMVSGWSQEEASWEQANGRKLSKREKTMHRISGALPRF